jgi:hypothetical protein
MKYLVQNKIAFPKGRYRQIAPGLFYFPNKNCVYSSFTLLGIQLSWKVENLEKNNAKVTVSRAYKKLVKMPIASIYPLGDLIKFVEQIKLVLKGSSFLLGGAVRLDNNKGLIVSSCGGMGKTTTILELAKSLRSGFLSDDTIIIKGKKIYPYREDIKIKTFGPVWLKKIKTVKVEEMFAKNQIIKKPVIAKYLFFLERGKRNIVQPIKSKDALKKVLTIMRKTFPYQAERAILGYFYANPNFDLNKIIKKEEKILSGFLKGIKCYTVTAKKAEDYHKLILGIL